MDENGVVTDFMRFNGYTDEEIEGSPQYFTMEIRDMAYDAANDRVLALCAVVDAEYGDEMSAGNAIYEVNMTDGTLTELYRITEYYNCMAMTVDDEGTVYYYNAYNDFYTAIDLASGTERDIVSLQTQSQYGDYESSHSLYFDELTVMIYHLFTSNGTFYRLFTVDPATGALNLEHEFVGDVWYNEDTWEYENAMVFVCLTFVSEAASDPEPEVIASGWSGYTTWALTDDGVLTVSPTAQTLGGKCNMKNYWKVNGVLTLPWGEYADQITKVVIEDGVNAIGQMAFYGLENLTTVVLPESLTEIRQYAFKNCTALTEVNLENVEIFREGAFYDCSSLMAIGVSDDARVEDWAFCKVKGMG